MSTISPVQKSLTFQEEVQFEVLRRLQRSSRITQRALAKDLGVGLGTINFCFKALIEKGLVKMHKFGKSKIRVNYVYLLTPAGVAEKSYLTGKLLKRKIMEHELLRKEIMKLKREIGDKSL